MKLFLHIMSDLDIYNLADKVKLKQNKINNINLE